MNYGDLGKRVLARIIDLIIISLIDAVIAWLTFALGGLSFGFFAVGIPLVLLTEIVYYVAMEGGSMHATVGKRVMELYVAGETGEGISYATAILRYLSKYVSGLILCIGYLMALFNNEKQCLHDMIAKTYVVSGLAEESRPHSGGFARQKRVSKGAFASNSQLIGITGPLAGTVYPIPQSGLTIGRDGLRCNIVVPESQAKVSRCHCLITYNPMSGMFVLSDRNSTHGTFLANGKRVPKGQPIALKSGDRFYLATPQNSFEVR